jgi:hypothetical protein
MDSALDQSIATALTEDRAVDEGGRAAWDRESPAESVAEPKELTAAESELGRWDAKFEARLESKDEGPAG